jgi:alpha-aminoadipic semialdehyde synthase
MLGIKREDKNRWERRAPLTPEHVAELIRAHGVRFRVEPSPHRAFPAQAYRSASAEVGDDLADCSVILGIKEVPPERLLAGKAYAFFSHVAKGQPANMGMLRRLLELRCTLLDYEKIVDDHGRRLVYFGRHAGHAGMIDTLWALGQHLVRDGIRTGLEEIRPAHAYAALDEAARHVTLVGERLRRSGLPDSLHPILFVFTGSGNVTRGALEIFDRLPFQEIFLEELPGFATDAARAHSVLYRLHLAREQRFERAGGGAFDAAELAAHPERYTSSTRRWLPAATVLVNGAYWAPGQPRLVAREDLQALGADPGRPKLRVIADIACDIDGAVAATVKATTPDDPVFAYDPATGRALAIDEGRGPWVLAIDNLPCELPVEASEHFGDALFRYVAALDACDWTAPLAALALPPEIRNALIVHRGELTPKYDYLREHLLRTSFEGGLAP